jgi:hypothetical protein
MHGAGPARHLTLCQGPQELRAMLDELRSAYHLGVFRLSQDAPELLTDRELEERIEMTRSAVHDYEYRDRWTGDDLDERSRLQGQLAHLCAIRTQRGQD